MFILIVIYYGVWTLVECFIENILILVFNTDLYWFDLLPKSSSEAINGKYANQNNHSLY